MKIATANILAATGLALLFTGCAEQHMIAPLTPNFAHKTVGYNKADMCILLKVDSDRPVQKTKLNDGWSQVDVAAHTVAGKDLIRIMSNCVDKTKQTSTIDSSAPLVRPKYSYLEKLPTLYHFIAPPK